MHTSLFQFKGLLFLRSFRVNKKDLIWSEEPKKITVKVSGHFRVRYTCIIIKSLHGMHYMHIENVMIAIC